MPEIDYEELTEDEIKAVALKSLEELDLQAKIQVVLNAFESEELHELQNHIGAAIGSEEQEEETD
jgi:hypothetical protein